MKLEGNMFMEMNERKVNKYLTQLCYAKKQDKGIDGLK